MGRQAFKLYAFRSTRFHRIPSPPSKQKQQCRQQQNLNQSTITNNNFQKLAPEVCCCLLCFCVLLFCWFVWRLVLICFLGRRHSQKTSKFRKIRKFSEAELVKVLLGRASFRTHVKAVLAMGYTQTLQTSISCCIITLLVCHTFCFILHHVLL